MGTSTLTSPFGPARGHLPETKSISTVCTPRDPSCPPIQHPKIKLLGLCLPPPREFCNAAGSSSAPTMMKQGRVSKARFLLAAGVVPTAAAAQPTSPKGFGQSEKGTAQIGSPGPWDGEMGRGARGGVRTSAADRLPLLVNQDQDEGQAEDAHDAGARRQRSGRDICKI